jgi:serine/threonine protein kinase/DNA-binding CsgD family transcriptional regulator/anti-sigma regulatory factor (Ser/Thr protein kinase)
MKATNGPPLRLNNRYRLVEWIAEGGMGVIYRAHDETLDRDVAIKFLSPHHIASEEASARFMREARAAARLSHPNIMTLYDVGREGAWHYMVLEYIPGQNLRAITVEQDKRLPIRKSLIAIRRVLEALAYAHAQGILHRDLKPDNVMLTPDGQVKLTDFGLSKIRGDMPLTEAHLMVGTALYMAPEVIAGHPADARTDLYAVGVMLYELLTGRVPFSGDTLTATLSQILHAPVPPLNLEREELSSEAESVIYKLLAKDPGGRYASAEEVLAALPDPALIPETASGTAETPMPSSLLERIIHHTSSKRRRPELAPVKEEKTRELAHDDVTLSISEELQDSLLLYAALDDTVAAVEAERRRLARMLRDEIMESLNLLLSQASAYERSLGAAASASAAIHTAFSMVTHLSRQVIQQVRDLEDHLHPSTLETLGLEPALESLANQVMRSSGVHINLMLERLPERLAPPLELALFRLAQNALRRAVRQANATQVSLRLERQESQLRLSLSDNGAMSVPGGEPTLRSARQRIEQLGGILEIEPGSLGGLRISISFPIELPVDLTPREVDVIQWLVEGLSNKEIAQKLFISPRTVNFHLDNIYTKLGVNSRTEAAVYALRHGWLRRPGG